MIRRFVLVAALMTAPSFGLAGDRSEVNWNYGLAPNGKLYVAYRFCKNNFCVSIQSQDPYEQTSIPLSDADNHPLIGAARLIENTIGAAVLDALIPGANRDFLIDDEIRAVSGSYVQRLQNASQAVYGAFSTIIGEVLLPTTNDEPLRNCIRAMARSARNSFQPDFLTSVQPECGDGPLSTGNYDRLMIVLELGMLHGAEVSERLEQWWASHSINVIDRNLDKKLDAILSYKSRLFTERFNEWGSSDAKVPSSVVAPIARAIAQGQEVWRKSGLRLTCANASAHAYGDSKWLRDWSALVEERLNRIKQFLVVKGEGIVREGLPARMLSDSLVPKASFRARTAILDKIGVAVQEGESFQSEYRPSANSISVTTGVAKDLCKSMEHVQNIEDIVAEDNSSLQGILGMAHEGGLHPKDFVRTLSRLNSQGALGVAEREELEFLSAIDFLLAHEVSHALFDYSKDSTLSDQRSREARADGFAFIVVDRTSALSMLKTFFKARIVNASGEGGRDSVKPWAETLPGGAALLKIFLDTRFERDAEHPPVAERMRSIENLLENPLGPTAR